MNLKLDKNTGNTINAKALPVKYDIGESLVNEIGSEVFDYTLSRGNSILKSFLGVIYFVVLIYFSIILFI